MFWPKNHFHTNKNRKPDNFFNTIIMKKIIYIYIYIEREREKKEYTITCLPIV
jgi:hypothetical protein